MKLIPFVVIPVLAVARPLSAAAQEEPSYFQQRVTAPTNAFELTVGTGYTQPFGGLRAGTSIRDLANAGAGVEIGGGGRVSPHWMVGGTAQYQEMGTSAPGAVAVRGTNATIDVTYHGAPYDRADPWVRLGTGYRALWTSSDVAPTALTHGLELARLTIGYDIRTSPDIALAPVVGADLNLFLWDRQGGTSVTISSPRPNTFVYAGVQARFDIGGSEAKSDVARR